MYNIYIYSQVYMQFVYELKEVVTGETSYIPKYICYK